MARVKARNTTNREYSGKKNNVKEKGENTQ